MGNPELGSEGQGTVRGGHGVLVEALAGSSAAAGFIAVIRGHTREAVPGTQRRIGVPPIAAGGVAGVVGMVVVMMTMMPGFG